MHTQQNKEKRKEGREKTELLKMFTHGYMPFSTVFVPILLKQKNKGKENTKLFMITFFH